MKHCIAIVLIVIAAATFGAELTPVAGLAKPSANKGKTGQYQCHTSHVVAG